MQDCRSLFGVPVPLCTSVSMSMRNYALVIYARLLACCRNHANVAWNLAHLLPRTVYLSCEQEVLLHDRVSISKSTRIGTDTGCQLFTPASKLGSHLSSAALFGFCPCHVFVFESVSPRLNIRTDECYQKQACIGKNRHGICQAISLCPVLVVLLDVRFAEGTTYLYLSFASTACADIHG